MLSQYTWGQFFLFVLALIGIYYLVIGLLYYRDELFAMLKGRKLARGPALAATGAPPALVRTTSVFAAAPAGEVATPPAEAAAGAADSLPEPATPLVVGTLPDSAAAKGSDAGTAEAAPMDADVTSAVEQEQQLDGSRPDEKLDEADRALAAMIRQAGAATAPADPAPVVLADELPADEATQPANEPDSPENPDESGHPTENSGDFSLEADIVYQPAVADDTDLFAAFAEPLASPLAIVPVEQEPLVEADSLAAFLGCC